MVQVKHICIILIDCKNIINSIDDKINADHLLDILATNSLAVQDGKTIILTWIPSYVDIVGNEIANKAA